MHAAYSLLQPEVPRTPHTRPRPSRHYQPTPQTFASALVMIGIGSTHNNLTKKHSRLFGLTCSPSPRSSSAPSPAHLHITMCLRAAAALVPLLVFLQFTSGLCYVLLEWLVAISRDAGITERLACLGGCESYMLIFIPSSPFSSFLFLFFPFLSFPFLFFPFFFPFHSFSFSFLSFLCFSFLFLSSRFLTACSLPCSYYSDLSLSVLLLCGHFSKRAKESKRDKILARNRIVSQQRGKPTTSSLVLKHAR